MSELIGFGQGDSAYTQGEVEDYKGEDNTTDLVSICWLQVDEETGELKIEGASPKFKAVEFHYIKGVGYVETSEYLQNKLGPPKARIGTFLVKYATNRQGDLKEPLGLEVHPWKFSETKYQDLARLHKRFPLTQNDFTITCTDKQFQKLSFMPAGDAIWQKNEKIRNMVLNKVKALEAKLDLARVVPEDELKEHYNEAVSPAASKASDINYDDLMDGLS